MVCLSFCAAAQQKEIECHEMPVTLEIVNTIFDSCNIDNSNIANVKKWCIDYVSADKNDLKKLADAVRSKELSFNEIKLYDSLYYIVIYSAKIQTPETFYKLVNEVNAAANSLNIQNAFGFGISFE